MNSDMRRVRLLLLSNSLLLDWLKGDWLKGYGGVSFDSDLPLDVELLGIIPTEQDQMWLRLWSESFSPVPHGEAIPTIEVTYTAHYRDI